MSHPKWMITAGFFLPTAVFVIWSHLAKQNTLGEFVDGVLSAVVFTLLFRLGLALHTDNVRTVSRRFGLLLGTSAGLVVWLGLWGFWSLVASQTRTVLGLAPFVFHVLLMVAAGWCAGMLTRRRWAAPSSIVSSLLLLVFVACLASTVPSVARAQQALQLVETFPIETTLDHADLPEAHEVWLEMIDGAQTSLDFGEFYASNKPGSRLETIVQAIERAADRGVQVRFLGDEKFYQTYPETLERLGGRHNITMRRYDMSKIFHNVDGSETAGGVLHAKYFIVDGQEAFVGSQNFDWRALEHIQELGLRIRHPLLVAPLLDIFETDWQIAGGASRGFRVEPPESGYGLPVTFSHNGSDVQASMAFSPRGLIPEAALWDLPHIVNTIDAAQKTVRVQLLSYKAVDWDQEYFDNIETALRKAAARQVKVQLLVADWGKRRGHIEGLKSLQCIPNIEVRMMTIPPWSGGFIPFARVIHAKYLVVDGEQSWLGTSNWSKNYFFKSRNVGIVVRGKSFGEQLDRYFERGWNSEYAYTIDPGATYEAPKRQ